MHKGFVVIFDLGDVLWDECPAVRHIADSVIGHLEKNNIHKTWEDWRDAYIQATHSREPGNRTSFAVHHLAQDASLAHQILDSLRSSVATMTVQAFSSLHPLRDDAHSVLMHLAQSYQLGILSNQPKIARALLDFYDLPTYFHRILISDEVGLKKPDIRMFEMILEAWSVVPNQVVMVGNRLDNDIAPAKMCGFRTILYECPNALADERSVRPETKPDVVVENLRDLKKVIPEIVRMIN